MSVSLLISFLLCFYCFMSVSGKCSLNPENTAFQFKANEIAFTRCPPQCICVLLRTFAVPVVNIKMPYRNMSVLIRTQY